MTVPTAGCAGPSVGFLDAGTKLARVDLTNFGDAPRRFEIRVRRDDGVVHESTHDIEGDGGAVLGTAGACPWMDTPGSYVVDARLGGGEWVSQSVDEGVDASREYAFVHVVYDAWNRDRSAFLTESAGEVGSRSDESCQLAATPADE